MRPDLGFEPEFPKSLVRCSTELSGAGVWTGLTVTVKTVKVGITVFYNLILITLSEDMLYIDKRNKK